MDENRFSMKIFSELRTQKYLEALDRNERDKAFGILRGDLEVFSLYDEGMYKELSHLMSLRNFREHAPLRNYVDAQTARIKLFISLKGLIEANPSFHRKLDFPSFGSVKLMNMIKQSFNMQHLLCENWRGVTEIKTLLTDHMCKPANMASTFSAVPADTVVNRNAFPALGVNRYFLNSGASTSRDGAASLLEPAIATATCMPFISNQVSSLIRPRPQRVNQRTVDEYDRLVKRLRSAPSSDEGPSSSVRAATSMVCEDITRCLDDLPRIVACNLYQGSTVMSMDFHPTRHTLLLVGCANGEVTLWELKTKEKVVSKPFMIRDINNHSSTFQAIVARNKHISVIRSLWSPDGCRIGVAFNKHLIHLYSHTGSNDLQLLLEVEAHTGSVNDLAFVHPNNRSYIATCGDDKLVKIWNFKGQIVYTFEGHQSPVYSMCPSQIANTQFIMSISTDGNIKAWMYDNLESKVNYTAPGYWCTTVLYSDDESRLFSCGTSRKGEPFLLEWIPREGKVKRTYKGLSKKPAGTVVHFDTTRNKYLAVGEDSQVKFWDMNNVEVLDSTPALGGLSSQPRLRFNKEGNLLAVSTNGNGFKILTTNASFKSLRGIETTPVPVSRPPSTFWDFGSAATIKVEDSNEENRHASKCTATTNLCLSKNLGFISI